jgi:hypothetical protein
MPPDRDRTYRLLVKLGSGDLLYDALPKTLRRVSQNAGSVSRYPARESLALAIANPHRLPALA